VQEKYEVVNREVQSVMGVKANHQNGHSGPAETSELQAILDGQHELEPMQGMQQYGPDTSDELHPSERKVVHSLMHVPLSIIFAQFLTQLGHPPTFCHFTEYEALHWPAKLLTLLHD
jgi:hypothetical protein